MRLKRFIDIPVLIFLFTYILQPTIASSDSLFAGNIETQLLEIQEDFNENPDLLEILLMVSKHWKPSLDLAPLKEETEKLTLSARQKLQGLDRPEAIIRTIRTVI
ncbi:uncharacterized protein METZ01_LOCUS402957, partial [marine metagenome]